jgi:hypothetical protein
MARRKCPVCGRAAQQGWSVCPTCGTLIPASADAPVLPSTGYGAAPSFSRRGFRYYHGVAIAVVVLLLGLSIAYDGRAWARLAWLVGLMSCGWLGRLWKQARAQRKAESPSEQQENKPSGWNFPM